MRNYLLSACYRLGISPSIWMNHNPIKIYEYLEVTRTVRLKPSDVVLDLGCGQGIWTIDLARHSQKVIGVDISKEAIATANRYVRNSLLKKRLDFQRGKLEELSIRKASIDHIFSFCVLEHIDNLATVLTEANQLLRPGGRLHVSVDSLATIEDATLKAKHRHDHSVTQYFSVESLKNYLSNAGFGAISIYPILKGDLASKEFQKRITGRRYHYGWFARRGLVKRFREEDAEQTGDKGIILVAHASSV